MVRQESVRALRGIECGWGGDAASADEYASGGSAAAGQVGAEHPQPNGAWDTVPTCISGPVGRSCFRELSSFRGYGRSSGGWCLLCDVGPLGRAGGGRVAGQPVCQGLANLEPAVEEVMD
jgi:hypothetical protein